MAQLLGGSSRRRAEGQTLFVLTVAMVMAFVFDEARIGHSPRNVYIYIYICVCVCVSSIYILIDTLCVQAALAVGLALRDLGNCHGALRCCGRTACSAGGAEDDSLRGSLCPVALPACVGSREEESRHPRSARYAFQVAASLGVV